MHQMLLITVLLCQAHARIPLEQDLNLSDGLRTIIRNILENFQFEMDDDFNFEAGALLNSIVTLSDYKSYSKNLHIIVLSEIIGTDYKLIDAYGYDKKFLVVQKEASYFDPEVLLMEGWIRKRAKIGILQFQTNNITLTSNLNLDNTKVCTRYFYEKYTSCDRNFTVSRHHLSKNYLKKLCRVRVSWVRGYPYVDDVRRRVNPGLMVSFFNIYSEKRYIKVAFKKNSSDYNYEFVYNGTIHKLSKELLEGKYDASIGVLFMNSTEDVPFYYGTVFINDNYFLVTKKRDKITSYKKLTIVFTVEVWKSFLITYLLATFSYFLLSVVIESRGFGFMGATFDVYRLSLSSGVSVLPQSVSLRLLFVFYSIFSINIDSAYLGTLSSIFTNAPYDIRLIDITDMMATGGAFNVDWLAERLLKLGYVARRSFSKFSKIGNMAKNESEEDLLMRIAYAQKNITITRRSTLMSHPHEASLVDYFTPPETAYLTMFIAFYIRRDFHLKDSLQYWSQQVLEKGFVKKWFHDIIEQNRNGSHIVKEKKGAIALKLQHFEEMFYLLSFGYTLAVATLILEFVYTWIDNRLGITKKIIFLFNLLKPPPMYD